MRRSRQPLLPSVRQVDRSPIRHSYASRLALGKSIALLIGLFAFATAAPNRTAVGAQGTPAGATPSGTETIELTGEIERPTTLTIADLQTLPVETVDVTYESSSGAQQHGYTGVRLFAVLERAGLLVDPDRNNDRLSKYVVMTAKDGYEVVISWGEIDPDFGNAPILLAWEEDGAPLTGEDGPVRLVTPGDVRGGRYAFGVISIEVRGVDSAPRT